MGRQPPYTGWFAYAVKRAGIERITPHDLRHTCASLAVSAGANVLALSKMLGHSKPSITLDVYADLFDSDLDAVAEALHNRRASVPISCPPGPKPRRKRSAKLPLGCANSSETSA
jgi:integrase